MYAAKRSGNSYAVYRPEDDPYDASRVLLRTDLHQAIDRGEIVLYYQPQALLESGHVSGVEGLARWHHPERGWIPPADFIPVAERMGLIKPLTARVVELAARQSQAWDQQGRRIDIAVNVSMRNLLDPAFSESIREIVARSAAQPGRLKFEITESAIMAEPERAHDTMTWLKRLGLGFAIDDFGTGYSSLAYLQRLPVQEIKVDRSFVGQLCANAGSAAIVRATIELAGSLGLNVVAEGVEDQPTWDALKRMGCRTAQGYFLSRPLPVDELEAWLDKWSVASTAKAA